MIYLTRLNKHPVVVNSELVKFVENTPDTVVTLVSGEKIVVSETVEQVVERIVEFRRRLMVANRSYSAHNQVPVLSETCEPTEE